MADINNRDLNDLKENLDDINKTLNAIGINNGLTNLTEELGKLVETLNYIPLVRHSISEELKAQVSDNENIKEIIDKENKAYIKLQTNIKNLRDEEQKRQNLRKSSKSDDDFDLDSFRRRSRRDDDEDYRRISDIRKDLLSLKDKWDEIRKRPSYILGFENSELEKLNKEKKDLLGDLGKSVNRDIQEKFYRRIESLTKKFFNEAKQDYKRAFKEAKDSITEVAKYDLSNSLVVNQKARQQALSLGLSNSQNYAYTQTQSLMGITGLEDFYWMNNNQRAMFNEIMQREEARYREMNSNGSLVGFQRVELEQKLLREEFKASIVKFISDNQDTIINFMRAGLNFRQGMRTIANWIFKAISGIAEVFNFSGQADWLSGLFNNGTNYSSNTSYTNSNKTYNISVNNTISGSGTSQDLADKISNSNLVALSNFFNS